MSNKKTLLSIITVVIVIAGLFIWNKQRQAQSHELVIGTTPAFTSILNVAVNEAKKQGVHVKLVEFSDWKMPNIALDHGDIDANFFQHQPFLNNAIKEGNYQLKIFGVGAASRVGLYSKKYQHLDDLPLQARVAIPNDPVNEGRALLLLQEAKLITLKDPNNPFSTLQDIRQNPKNLQFIEMEGPQTARAVDDVDLAFSYPQYLKLAKTIAPDQALLLNKNADKIYAIVFAVKNNYDDKNDQLKKFVEIYQNSPEVKAALDREIGASLWYAGW
ncbi:MetQ/NlpA family ABC transporter substrate-binding protein [Acinetobacter sp. B5B]|uniref:MetQ/NlpA family ABC transporter substrate-binding protein n=1 Tax=Acinetobacter baretiae TaxID=2605383 RepID=UPI0018C21E94|nr:MetQ/NlpA family ABC transporter substrate-binding protein [Acinetobacter baretiae]MBF7683266.1 MetQ/NlpA family ABC transporter substrate-binding protein [Acinetobacter baretiae]MBF7684458.1 MetQ/NlpA family ABC transporter substrate-binding protein [Acinetobacter baretiae]